MSQQISARPLPIRIPNHNQTVMSWIRWGNHNQTVIRTPSGKPQHNQTVILPRGESTQHNQTLVRR